MTELQHLYALGEGGDLGIATPEQVAASDSAEARGYLSGAFGIDKDGNPVPDRAPGVWKAVYTATEPGPAGRMEGTRGGLR